MNLMMPTRREFTAGLGSIIVSFSLDPKLAFAQQAAKLPGSLAENRMLDAWIRINADGSATIGYRPRCTLFIGFIGAI